MSKRCDPCGVNVRGQAQYRNHIQSQGHLRITANFSAEASTTLASHPPQLSGEIFVPEVDVHASTPPDMRWKCSPCNMQCADRQSYKRHTKSNQHRRVMGLPLVEKKFSCQRCGRKLMNASSLRRHYRHHRCRGRKGANGLKESSLRRDSVAGLAEEDASDGEERNEALDEPWGSNYSSFGPVVRSDHHTSTNVPSSGGQAGDPLGHEQLPWDFNTGFYFESRNRGTLERAERQDQPRGTESKDAECFIQ